MYPSCENSAFVDDKTGQRRHLIRCRRSPELAIIVVDNKLGLYRQCVGARIGGGMRRNMFADALLIQPVVLSRGTVMPTMGIECSGAVGGGCGWWYSQGLACLPGLLEVDGRVNRGRRTPLKRDSGVAETHE